MPIHPVNSAPKHHAVQGEGQIQLRMNRLPAGLAFNDPSEVPRSRVRGTISSGIGHFEIE